MSFESTNDLGRLPGGFRAHKQSERGNDLYETPPEAVRALLEVEQFKGPIWEPACGPGAIVRVLRDLGLHVVASDIDDYGCPDSKSRIDFLMEQQIPQGIEALITNPPYSLADEFARHALDLGVPRIALLLKTIYISGQRERSRGIGASDILDAGRLAEFLPFANRLPVMHRHGWEGKKIESSSVDHAWFVWDQSHRGDTICRRLWWRAMPSKSAMPAAAMSDANQKAMTNTIEQQVQAVERAAVNQRGHVDNLRSLIARGRRSKDELDLQEAWTPALEDAAITMRRLCRQEHGLLRALNSNEECGHDQ
jgi:hypothetical protein